MFMAAATNYAEAFRLAVAYAWQHEHSDVHKAALSGFHSAETPQETAEEKLLRAIFEEAPPSERDLRLQAARAAAKQQQNLERRSRKRGQSQ
jgi:isochorismate hydrolase